MQFEFNILLMLWGLLICLIYSIFAGWIMKISHLRKSMNFSNELFYNLWRIAIRIVLPYRLFWQCWRSLAIVLMSHAQVWVAYAAVNQQFLIAVPFTQGMTAIQAIELSQIRQQIEIAEPLNWAFLV
jgi:hypothetical protein